MQAETEVGQGRQTAKLLPVSQHAESQKQRGVEKAASQEAKGDPPQGRACPFGADRLNTSLFHAPLPFGGGFLSARLLRTLRQGHCAVQACFCIRGDPQICRDRSKADLDVLLRKVIPVDKDFAKLVGRVGIFAFLGVVVLEQKLVVVLCSMTGVE